MDDLGYASHYQPLDRIIGLTSAIRVLWGTLEREQVASAYLLKGPEGVGKTTLAVAYAQASACLNPRRNPYRACEECESCRRVASGTQPEIVLIQPAGDQTQIWQLWDRDRRGPGVLEHSLNYTPAIGRKRVYIFERAETLTPAAANSMLKVLEEAPPYAVFLLLTATVDRILPTILSRCQVLAALPPAQQEFERWLREVHGVPDAQVAVIAALSDGLPGAAVRFVRNPGAIEEIEGIVRAGIELTGCRPLSALRAAEQLRNLAAGLKALKAESAPTEEPESGEAPPARTRTSRRDMATVLRVLLTVYRDMLLLRLDPEGCNVSLRQHITELRTCASSRTPAQWREVLDMLTLALRRLEQNVSPQLVTDWITTAIALSGNASGR